MYEKLRDIRKQKNVKPIELAKIIGLKTAAAYFKKESGAIKFSLYEAKTIANYFDKPIEEIFFKDKVSETETGEEEPPRRAG